jgi:capsular exopolysaccharide synthesis family protein
MELRDYVRMLKRGWPTIMLITALFLGLASLYVAVAPKRYESSTTLLISADSPQGISDLHEGRQFAASAVNTYAEIVDSATVLGPIAAELRPQRNVDDLIEMVTVSVPEDTTLINIAVAGDDARQAMAVANAAALSATRIIPTLEDGPEGPPLVRTQQIRPAVEPLKPVSPNVQRMFALGLIVGLCVGLGVTIATQTLDTRIRFVDDLSKLTDVPRLAVVPHLKRGQRHGLVVQNDPTGMVGEAFRTLRTNLRFLEAKERRSLVCTSVADSRDGALVPTNLAWTLAQAGRRVLLVDLDSRQSVVGDALGIPASAGLTDVLTGRIELPDVVHATQHDRLCVLLSGTAQPSPSDLLSAPMMTSVLRRVEQEYDFVILHAPSLLSYTDAAVVSGAAGGTLVTVSVGRTRAQELTTALSALSNVWVKPVGMVITGVRRGAGTTRGPGAEPRPQPPVTTTSARRHHATASTVRASSTDRRTSAVPVRHPSSGATRPTPAVRPDPRYDAHATYRRSPP